MAKGTVTCGNIAVLIIAGITYYYFNFPLELSEEFYYRTGDFIKKNGYNYEEYTVESSDGFLSSIFHIVQKNGPSYNKSLPPLLIEAGLFCSSDILVLSSSDITYTLVEAGFDVWLGNYRGSRYSRPGPAANLSNPLLMYYGLDEQSTDFAAAIDFILEKTGNDHLDIIVISAGSGNLLSLLARQPEYNEKIRKALHFGPGFSFKMANWEQKLFFGLTADYPWLFVSTGIMEWHPTKSKFFYLLCVKSYLAPLCPHLSNKLVGIHRDHVEPDEYALTISFFPAGTPVGIVGHLVQLTRGDGVFRKRDWGVAENLRLYNSSIPPKYEVEKITAFNKAYIARNEVLVNCQVPRQIFSEMPNFAGEFIVEPPFQHINFALNGNRNAAFVNDVIRTLSVRDH